MSNGQSSDDKTVISITYLYIEKYVEGRDRDFGCLVGMANLKKSTNKKDAKKSLQQSTDENHTRTLCTFVQYICVTHMCAYYMYRR